MVKAMMAFFAPRSFFFALLVCAMPLVAAAEEVQDAPLGTDVASTAESASSTSKISIPFVQTEPALSSGSFENATSTESAAPITPEETSPQEAAMTTETVLPPAEEDAVSTTTFSVAAEDAPTEVVRSAEDAPGIVEGTGTDFLIEGSEYLEIGTESSEKIKLRIDSIPDVVVLRTWPSPSATSTTLTLTGFRPNTTYYKYEDSYHNLAIIQSDEEGSYSYTQDVSESHRVFIQPKKSTKFIKNDATGGDCASVGTWDVATLTCTLASDLFETTQIDGDGITLDGAGHTTTGSKTGNGVYVNGRSGVTIKNLNIKDFSFGVFLWKSPGSVVASTSISNTQEAVVLDPASESVVENNAFTNNVQSVVVFDTQNAAIRNNTVVVDSKTRRRYQGLVFFDSTDNVIEGNAITMNDDVIQDGIQKVFAPREGIVIFDSTGNTIVGNTLSKLQKPLLLFDSSGHRVYHNNFLQTGKDFSDNRKPAAVSGGEGNTFFLASPQDGNYWDLFDTPEEGCEDVDANGRCDAPYALSGGQDDFSWTTKDGWLNAPDPCAEPGACVSNVLFLPGIQGSRLYEGVGCGGTEEEKLWEPFDSVLGVLRGEGDDKMRKLFLNDAGESVCTDIYVKKDGVLDTVGGAGFYQALIDQMDGFVADGVIDDWEPLAYDWRLSLDDLLTKGREEDGKIFYTKATTTPYIEQTLRALAAGSKSGKVTIIAHSNGGLLAKALLRALGVEAASLVDQVIMVGVPQTGAPEAVGVTLLGHNAGIYQYGIPIVSNAAARAFAQNSPMAYHLLPSSAYIESVKEDATHPLARFAGEAYAPELELYGTTTDTFAELTDFLLAKNGEREDPEEGDLYDAEVLKAPLMSYAERTHADLDAWIPPEEITFHQIAGWGVDTVAGVDFYTQSSPLAAGPVAAEPRRLYRPLFVEDGDGTVPVPSALAMASSTNVKRYWLDLYSFNKTSSEKRKHGDLFETQPLQDFLKNLIENGTSTSPYVTSNQPPAVTESKKLTFYLHSPLTLQLSDSSGNTTGLSADGEVTQEIQGATYGEFGEVKYIIAPAGEYTLAMQGLDSGTFSLDIQESSGGEVTTSVIADVPTTASTTATLRVSGGLETVSALSVDTDGNGVSDIELLPLVGQTVVYTLPEETETAVPASGGRARFVYPLEVIATSVPVVASTTVATTSIVQALVPAASAATAAPPTATTSIVAARVKAIPQPPDRKIVVVATVPAKEARPLTALQTASVYDAVSQQGLFSEIGAAVYNGLHSFWLALMRLF